METFVDYTLSALDKISYGLKIFSNEKECDYLKYDEVVYVHVQINRKEKYIKYESKYSNEKLVRYPTDTTHIYFERYTASFSSNIQYAFLKIVNDEVFIWCGSCWNITKNNFMESLSYNVQTLDEFEAYTMKRKRSLFINDYIQCLVENYDKCCDVNVYHKIVYNNIMLFKDQPDIQDYNKIKAKLIEIYTENDDNIGLYIINDKKMCSFFGWRCESE